MKTPAEKNRDRKVIPAIKEKETLTSGDRELGRRVAVEIASGR